MLPHIVCGKRNPTQLCAQTKSVRCPLTYACHAAICHAHTTRKSSIYGSRASVGTGCVRPVADACVRVIDTYCAIYGPYQRDDHHTTSPFTHSQKKSCLVSSIMAACDVMRFSGSHQLCSDELHSRENVRSASTKRRIKTSIFCRTVFPSSQ